MSIKRDELFCNYIPRLLNIFEDSAQCTYTIMCQFQLIPCSGLPGIVGVTNKFCEFALHTCSKIFKANQSLSHTFPMGKP